MNFEDWLNTVFDDLLPNDKLVGFTYTEVIDLMKMAWEAANADSGLKQSTESDIDDFPMFGGLSMSSPIKKVVLSIQDNMIDKHINDTILPVIKLQQEQLKELNEAVHNQDVQITSLKRNLRKVKDALSKITGSSEDENTDEQKD